MIFYVWRGWSRGFVLGLMDLLVWIGSILLALQFYQPVAEQLAALISWSETWAGPLAFLVLALVAGIIISFLGNALLRRLPDRVHSQAANRALGLFPGFVNGLITAAVLAAMLSTLPLPQNVQIAAHDSQLATRLANQTRQVEVALAPVFGGAIEQTINLLTVRPESDERVVLPYRVRNPRARPDLERQMLEWVNRERAMAGLAPLVGDPELTEVARRHSADMFMRGYFSHLTPEGRDPFDRMRSAGVSFITAGENLAHAPTLTLAHNGLMNSPGHRANIMRREFGRVGIGIMDGGMRGLMITQSFRN
jgi:uncharacterized protein YkwD